MAEDQQRNARAQSQAVDEDQRGKAEGQRRQQQRRHEQHVDRPCAQRRAAARDRQRRRGAEHDRDHRRPERDDRGCSRPRACIWSASSSATVPAQRQPGGGKRSDCEAVSEVMSTIERRRRSGTPPRSPSARRTPRAATAPPSRSARLGLRRIGVSSCARAR